MTWRHQFEHGAYREGTAYRRNRAHKKKGKTKDPWREKLDKKNYSRSKENRKTKRYYKRYGSHAHRQRVRYWLKKDPEQLHNRDFLRYQNPWVWYWD